MSTRGLWCTFVAVVSSLAGPAYAQSSPEDGEASRSPDPATVERAREAKARGHVIDFVDPAAIVGCRELGDAAASSALAGFKGRVELRGQLRAQARARGASHLRYADYAAGEVQRERAWFFDCAGPEPVPSPAEPAPPPAAPAVALPGAPPALPEPSPTTAAQAAQATPAEVPPVAHAATTPPPGAPSRPLAEAVLQLELVPAGSLNTDGVTDVIAADVPTTVGVSGRIDVLVHRNIALGLGSGLVFGLKAAPGAMGVTELDLRADLRFGQLVRDGLALAGYATLGGSWLVLPDDTSAGAAFGFGVSVKYPLRDATFVAAEIGYQIGYQRVSIDSIEGKLASDLLHVGIGVGTYL
jgi:hypothetical protein